MPTTPTDTAPTKTCSKCREVLTLDCFGTNRARKDGLDGRCRSCIRTVNREARQRRLARPGGRDSLNEYARDFARRRRATAEGRGAAREATVRWLAKPGNREVHRQSSRRSKARPEAIEAERVRRTLPDVREARLRASREAARKRLATPEGRAKANAASRQHYASEEGRESTRRKGQQYRSRKLDLPATLTSADWQEILAAFSHACAYCGTTDRSLTQEHVIPVTKGGGYERGNIVPSCGSCNSSKGNRDLAEWLSWKFPSEAVEIAQRLAGRLGSDLAVSA